MGHKQEKLIDVDVVYARSDAVQQVSLQLQAGSSAHDAIKQSGLLQLCPEIDLTKNKIGIFNKIQELDVTLRDRDRVEIYRPLLVDPKEARRRRASVRAKSGNKG